MNNFVVSNNSGSNNNAYYPRYSSNVTHKDMNDKSTTQPLEGGQSQKIGGIKKIKHYISSPKFYKLLIKIIWKETLLLIWRISTIISIYILIMWKK